MNSSSNYSELELIVWPVVALVALVSYMYKVYRRKRRAPSKGSSVLLTYYTDGVKDMMPLAKGKIGDMDYSAIAIVGHADASVNSVKGAMLYMVTLPYKTDLHLLGIPKIAGVVQLKPAAGNSSMEAVILEGDYPNHFSLYAEKGMQSDVRYALDPKAMLFTMEFCKSHNWEVVGSCLYFVQAGNRQHKDDPTYMFDDIERFVDEIKPVVSSGAPNADVYAVTAKRLAVTTRSSKFKCPICSSPLLNEVECHRCPNGHGIFLLGAKLGLVKNGTIANPIHEKVKRSQYLKCSSCKNSMDHVQYGNRSTFIDSCSKCPYRWLDAGELQT